MVPLVILLLPPALLWLGLLFDPARRWDFRPTDASEPPREPSNWPEVAVLIPARNEAASLPQSLPAWLEQDYPGKLTIFLIDDRSSDGTADIAKGFHGRHPLQVLTKTTLPEGWMGKVAALDFGLKEALNQGDPPFILATDADIRHAPDSLRRLVAQSLEKKLGLNSRMARLRCESAAEKWTIPAFVYFFNLLYPMRRINRSDTRTYGAAGGCVLLSRGAIRCLGDSFAPIRHCVIDDVNLAREVKERGQPIRLELSVDRVVSHRPYPTFASVAGMVSRSAYAQLGYHPWLGALTLLGLLWLFLMPVVGILFGLLFGHAPGLVLGLTAWVAMSLSFRPAIRFYHLPLWRMFTLPIAGLLYGGMTLQSIIRHHRGEGVRWREASH